MAVETEQRTEPLAQENPRHALLRISDGYPAQSDDPPERLAWHLAPKPPPQSKFKYPFVDLVAGIALAYPLFSPTVQVGDRPIWFLALLLLSILHSVKSNFHRAETFPQPLRYFLWSVAFTYIRATISLQYQVPLLLIPVEVGILKDISKATDLQRRIVKLDLREGYFVGWKLSRYLFKDVDFRLADFSHATFENVHFESCNLEEVIANGATFINCTFTKCRLDLGQFRRSTWTRTKVEQSSLTYADLQDATFDRKSTILKSDCDQASFVGSNAIQRVQDPPKPLRQNA